MKKREMTPRETNKVIKYLQKVQPKSNIKKLWTKAKSEGYKDEICDCGKAFPAHIDFVRCQEEVCPMKSSDNKSLLQMLKEANCV